MALLAEGGEIAAQGTEGRRSGGTAESAGDLLLDFDHAQILFSLIIRERLGSVLDEAKDLVGAMQQHVQKILGRRLFAPAPSLGPILGGLSSPLKAVCL